MYLKYPEDSEFLDDFTDNWVYTKKVRADTQVSRGFLRSSSICRVYSEKLALNTHREAKWISVYGYAWVYVKNKSSSVLTSCDLW